MLCSRCYKKIPEGEEISKPAFSFIRVNGQPLNHGGILCKRCAKNLDKSQWIYLVFFITISLVISIAIIAFRHWVKKH